MNHSSIRLGAVIAWLSFVGLFLYKAPRMISLKDHMLMMPQWCVMTDLTSSKSYILLSPQTTLWCWFTTLMLLSICWFYTAEDDIDEASSVVKKVDQNNKARLAQDTITEEVLIENAKSLLEMVDLEYQHCAATIAANNETPGEKVGGEIEWATGETSSEDEDATREVTGAKIRKTSKETEDEKMLKFLQEPSGYFPVKEPNLRMLSNEVNKI